LTDVLEQRTKQKSTERDILAGEKSAQRYILAGNKTKTKQDSLLTDTL
jgi:hypothetical protein